MENESYVKLDFCYKWRFIYLTTGYISFLSLPYSMLKRVSDAYRFLVNFLS